MVIQTFDDSSEEIFTVESIQFNEARLFNALTLIERVPGLSERKASREESPDQSEIKRRLIRWESHFSPGSESLLADRLSLLGLSQDEFNFLITESFTDPGYPTSSIPIWMRSIVDAFSECRDTNTADWERPEVLGFAFVFLPIIRKALEDLTARIHLLEKEVPSCPIRIADPCALFLRGLTTRINPLLTRTMVLELNVARLREELAGATPEERFISFLNLLSHRKFAAGLLEEYPVLARIVQTVTANWASAITDFIGHLFNDWPLICETFNYGTDPGQLAHVQMTGDSHRQGRSVVVVTFTSGLKLVHKPRSLSIDIHFQELLEWLNSRGAKYRFKTIRILDRGCYGWSEFVDQSGCLSREEVERFYWRQGGYLALLYLLEATDFHSENLIASGEYPVLVDLETLFHSRMAFPESGAGIDSYVHAILQKSVLRIGLLPHRLGGTPEQPGIDVSGIGGAAGQVIPFKVITWDKPGTDEMRAVLGNAVMTGRSNRPLLNGVEIEAMDYADSITRGFESIYQLLLKYRHELLSDTGPIARFKEDRIREILRNTSTYMALLTQSYHPDLMRNALDRDCLLDRLWNTAGTSLIPPALINAELEDLRSGDVPLFESKPGSCDVWTSRGERISGIFDRSSMELVLERICGLSEEDLERQTRFIRGSMTALAMGVESESISNGDRSRPLISNKKGFITGRGSQGNRRELELARKLGDRIESLSLRDNGQAIWIGVAMVGETSWQLAPLALDLYNGISGVSIFLAYAGKILKNNRYTRLAAEAMETVRVSMKSAMAKSISLDFGGFGQLSGYIYTLIHASVLWDDAHLLEEAEQALSLFPQSQEEDDLFDIMSGSAGSICVLLSLYSLTRSPKALNLAIRCGEHLVANSHRRERGAGWINRRIEASQPLTGFSHGASGIASALIRLWEESGDSRFRREAMEALEYERSTFSPDDGNWPDFRIGREKERGEQRLKFVTAWCHGAPGIGLSRLEALRQDNDSRIAHELQVAIGTTFHMGLRGNHSLCHGDLGNIELLIEAHRSFPEAGLKRRIEEMKNWILDSIERNGYRCGVPLGAETPGLMTGLAGIGMGLLRLAEPEQVPSVLLLAPPPLF